MPRRQLLHLTDAERRTLAIPGLIALGAFLIVTLCVFLGITHHLDVSLIRRIYRTSPGTDHFLTQIEAPGQRKFVYPAAIILGTLISYRRKDLLPVIITVAALVFTNAVTGALKLVVARGNPRIDGPGAFNYAAIKGDGSLASYAHYVWQLGTYPSGHAANVAAASTLAVLAAYSARAKHRKWALPITLLAVIVCTITVICSWLRDTHWMTDLIAGLALGVATTIATTLWALHLPEQWRHPDLAGAPRMIIFYSGVLFMLLIFSFASSSVLSHSGTSVVLVVGVLVVVARQSHKTIKRANSTEEIMENA